MNKGFHIAVYAAILGVFLMLGLSCSKMSGTGKDTDAAADSLEYAGGYVQIKARIEGSMLTKVSYPSSGVSVWNGGDEISVFAVDTNGIYRNVEFFSIENGPEITFTGKIPKGFKLADRAVYPYSGRHSFGTLSTGGKSFSINLTSSKSDKGMGTGSLPMVGFLDAEGVFVFHHITGALKVTLINMPSGNVTVRLNTKEHIAGIFEADVETGSIIYNDCRNKSTKCDITVHADDSGNAVAIFPLVEGKYSDVSITCFDAYGSEFLTQTFPNALTIKTGEFSELSAEFVVDTTADFSRWMNPAVPFENYVETVDLAQHGQLLNGCDTLFYMVSADTLYGYISVSVKTAAMKEQLRFLRVFIDHKDDQTTEFNPIYDIGWLDLPVTPKTKDGPHADLMFEGSIYQSGKIRKVQDNIMTLYKISPGEDPTESWGWAGGVTKGNGTHETIDHGFAGSGVLEEVEDGERFRYQFEIARDVALITEADVQGYTLGGEVTGKVNVMLVVSAQSYGKESICPDRGGTDLQLL
ncbi:MAG: hypothetical protein J6Y32_03360 [Bacteroidales bacterium]|nr:hypothetical protein [Bacteroidales bacterium]